MVLISSATLTSCSSDDDGCTARTWYQDLDGDGLGNSAVTYVSCTQPTGYVDNANDSDDTPGNSNNIVEVTGNITSDVTWTTGNIYILTGRIAVTQGATLTIQPGVIVKGQAGTGANATALLIARDGKLMAEGTAQLPIIFTSVADEISPADIANGNFASPNLDSNINGLWGGIIVLGKAPLSASANEIQIEGIPSSDTNGLYGGTDATHNSGVIKYVSIRHGGANIGEGNEINGLTLGGVGSGTVIEHVEVVANQDDGIEWFGGTVNVSNVVVWNCGDDAIDTDQGWNGTLNNFAIISSGNHAFELDGPEGTAYFGNHTIMNGYIQMSNAVFTADDIINTDDNSNVELSNLYFTALQDGQRINRINAANVSFNNIYLDTTADDLINRLPEGTTEVPGWLNAGNINTFNAGVLNWTWASQANAL